MQDKNRILIVDDDESICSSFSEILQKKGFVTDTARTGKEAIEKSKGRFFNIAILDIKLPDIEGTKILQQLKEISSDTEVIMITAYALLESAVEALNKGAYAYIIKPAKLDEVMFTVQKALEKQKLALENKHLFENLMKAVEELKRLDQLKNEFVSTVSHELRTPLTIIKEGINLVSDKTVGLINEKQTKLLSVAKDNIDRLARIISNLLDISKIEAGRAELKRVMVDIPCLLKDVCAGWKTESDKKNQELFLSLPESSLNTYIDPDKITQVLNNLLSNALRYTPEGGKITVELKDQKEQIEISVSDTGVGIDKEDLPRLFTKFQQFSRMPGPGERGTGLGLAISKQLIEMHQGSIEVESEINQGSKFSFFLPKMDVEEVFKEYINNGIKEAASRNSYLSLVLVRVLGFDKFQEKWDSQKAHNLLKDLERVINSCLRRRADTVVRNTGELIVLLYDIKKEDLGIVKKRIEDAIHTYLSSSKEKLSEEIRVCFGNVTYPEEATNDKELLEKVRVYTK